MVWLCRRQITFSTHFRTRIKCQLHEHRFIHHRWIHSGSLVLSSGPTVSSSLALFDVALSDDFFPTGKAILVQPFVFYKNQPDLTHCSANFSAFPSNTPPSLHPYSMIGPVEPLSSPCAADYTIKPHSIGIRKMVILVRLRY